jgi:hypothetical protein
VTKHIVEQRVPGSRCRFACPQRLVRPAEPVTDFRTAVTGRTAADLEAVDYSIDDAQRDVLSVLQGVCCAVVTADTGSQPAC